MAVIPRKTIVAAAAATAITALGLTAAPAFAKSDTALSGPRTAQVRHAFHLTVTVGDDAVAKPTRARLQIRDAHGNFHWYGGWQRLHRTGNPFHESAAFSVTGQRRGPETFRAVVPGYATTNAVTIVVR
jgi:hypothetical protein